MVSLIVLLSVVTVLAWGSWIPIAQAVPGVAQQVRALYAAVGNLVIATAALVVGGGELGLGWKQFWLPLAGGLVWVVGNYAAFRATDLFGLARAAGSWTPLNIVVSFVWGGLLFDELAGFGAARYARLGAALVIVLGGVAFIGELGAANFAIPPFVEVAGNPPARAVLALNSATTAQHFRATPGRRRSRPPPALTPRSRRAPPAKPGSTPRISWGRAS